MNDNFHLELMVVEGKYFLWNAQKLLTVKKTVRIAKKWTIFFSAAQMIPWILLCKQNEKKKH
jgi:hypothetical protein